MDESGFSSTWRFVGVGVDMFGFYEGAGGGVVARGRGVAGFVVERD